MGGGACATVHCGAMRGRRGCAYQAPGVGVLACCGRADRRDRHQEHTPSPRMDSLVQLCMWPLCRPTSASGTRFLHHAHKHRRPHVPRLSCISYCVVIVGLAILDPRVRRPRQPCRHVDSDGGGARGQRARAESTAHRRAPGLNTAPLHSWRSARSEIGDRWPAGPHPDRQSFWIAPSWSQA